MPPGKYMGTDCEAKISLYPILPYSCRTEPDAPMPIFQRALCVCKLENIKGGTNKKQSQHSALSSQLLRGRNDVMITFALIPGSFPSPCLVII